MIAAPIIPFGKQEIKKAVKANPFHKTTELGMGQKERRENLPIT